MEKAFVKSLLICVACLISHTVSAYDFEVGGIRYNIVSIDNLTCEVAPNSYSDNIYIPTYVQYNGHRLKVVGIGESAFSGCSSMKSVILPDQLEYIKRKAFENCSGLKEMRIPLTLKEVGRLAFKGCCLQKVYINNVAGWCSISFDEDNYGRASSPINSNTVFYVNEKPCETLQIPQSVTIIKPHVFEDINTIRKVEFPNSIKRIERSAFSGCKNIESITLPYKCGYIGEFAFSSCPLTNNLFIPAAVDTIGAGAFNNCHLDHLLFEEGVKEIKINPLVFGKVKQLTICRNIKLWDTTSNHAYWIDEIDSLEVVTISPKVTSLPSGIFEYFTGIKNVTIEDGDTELEISCYKWVYDYSYVFYCGELYKSEVDYFYLGRNCAPKPIGPQAAFPGLFNMCGVNHSSSSAGSIKTLIIGDKVEEYGENSHWLLDFTGVTRMDLGRKFKYVPDMSECTSLKCIILRNPIPPTAVGFANTTYLHCDLYVPKGCVNKYKSANVWKNFWNISEIDESVLGIETDEIKSNELCRYTIDGTQITSPQRGINIVKMSDGTTKKVLVK